MCSSMKKEELKIIPEHKDLQNKKRIMAFWEVTSGEEGSI